MKKYTLEAHKRTIVGKKVSRLRAKGVIPANIFGKKIQSLAIEIDAKAFQKVFAHAGETGIVEVTVGGKAYPTLIQNVQIHPISRKILHVDCHHVDLHEKVKVKVPVEIVGEALAVKDKKGVLLTLLSEIEVEALPTELPEDMKVDVANLSEVGQVIKVENLTIPSGVTVHTDLQLEVVKIGALVTKEVQKEAKAEEEAKAAAAAATTPVEGAAAIPAEGEAKKEVAPAAAAEEKKKETPKEEKKAA